MTDELYSGDMSHIMTINSTRWRSMRMSQAGVDQAGRIKQIVFYV